MGRIHRPHRAGRESSKCVRAFPVTSRKCVFNSGQLVKKGDVLFVIDPRWHQAEFDQRQAEYEQAKVHLENAEREAERTDQLLANKAISTEEADAREARYQGSQGGLARRASGARFRQTRSRIHAGSRAD